jgi:hypothetical protein
MNGIHDMGGMEGFGRVIREENEPLFHYDWERRMIGIGVLAGFRINADEFRHAIERIAPVDYLASSWTLSLNGVDPGDAGSAKVHQRVRELVAAWHPVLRRLVEEADTSDTYRFAITAGPWCAGGLATSPCLATRSTP